MQTKIKADMPYETVNPIKQSNFCFKQHLYKTTQRQLIELTDVKG